MLQVPGIGQVKNYLPIVPGVETPLASDPLPSNLFLLSFSSVWFKIESLPAQAGLQLTV